MTKPAPLDVVITVDARWMLSVAIDGQVDDATVGVIGERRGGGFRPGLPGWASDHIVAASRAWVSFPPRTVESYRRAERAVGLALATALETSCAERAPWGPVDAALVEGKKTGRRVRVFLRFEAPELDRFAWEFLGGWHLAGSDAPWGVREDMTLVRLGRDGPVAANNSAGTANLVLVSGAFSGSEPAWAVHKTLERLVDVRAKQARWWTRGPLGALRPATQPPQGGVDVYHYIGHGNDAQSTYRYDTDDLTARELVERLEDIAGAAPLIFAFACHGSNCLVSTMDGNGPAYEQLLTAGANSVVATQGLFALGSAASISLWLYTELARGLPVDAATQSARRWGRKVAIDALKHPGGRRGAECRAHWRQLVVATRSTRHLGPLEGFVLGPLDKQRALVEKQRLGEALGRLAGEPLSLTEVFGEEPTADEFPVSLPLIEYVMGQSNFDATESERSGSLWNLRLAVETSIRILNRS